MWYVWLTTVTAKTCTRVKTLVMSKNQVGSKGFSTPIKFERTVTIAWLPNAQYPEIATLKYVVIITL